MDRKENNLIPLPPSIVDIIDQLFQQRPHLESARQGLVSSYRALAHLFEVGGIFYLCGNGGSFADAVHIKGELAKGFESPRPITNSEIIGRLQKSEPGPELAGQLEQGLPVIVLGESHSLRSAYENDRQGRFSYAQELNAFAAHIKPGVLMGISNTGNAQKVIAPFAVAPAKTLTTISFTGPGGGRMAPKAEIDWRAPGESTAEIQENQTPLYHALCRMIETHFFR